MTEGLAGGYPGSRNRFVWVHNDNDRNLPAAIAYSLQEMPGRKEDVSWGVYPLKERDVLYVASNGGGGFFDPLERNPEAVASDVRQSVVSREAALLVYGTVIDEELGVDAASTTAVREEVRSKRRAGMATL